jgi:hypothetical protein
MKKHRRPVPCCTNLREACGDKQISAHSPCLVPGRARGMSTTTLAVHCITTPPIPHATPLQAPRAGQGKGGDGSLPAALSAQKKTPLKPGLNGAPCNVACSRYCIELAACEKTPLAFDPIMRTVPTTNTRITASMTAYSAMSCPCSSLQSWERGRDMLGTNLRKEMRNHSTMPECGACEQVTKVTEGHGQPATHLWSPFCPNPARAGSPSAAAIRDQRLTGGFAPPTMLLPGVSLPGLMSRPSCLSKPQ